MSEKPRYFVGRYSEEEPYMLKASHGWYEPGKGPSGDYPTTGDVIWRGDNRLEGLEVQKQANAKRRAAVKALKGI